MATELRVTLPGPEGSADARRALGIVERVLTLVGQIEDVELRKRAKRADERSTWGISEIGLGSLVVTLAPNQPKRGATADNLADVCERAVDGFASAELYDGVPEGWDREVADTAAELARQLGLMSDSGMRLELLTDGNTVRDVTVTRRTEQHLRAGLSEHRQTIGALIGQLDTISLHDRREAGLWLEGLGGRIGVRFDVAQFDQVKAALGHRVEVAGRITRDFADRPMSIKMTAIELLPEVGPSLTGLVGLDPDMTGGLDVDDYLGTIRDAS